VKKRRGRREMQTVGDEADEETGEGERRKEKRDEA
jgi:hypothetical protein